VENENETGGNVGAYVRNSMGVRVPANGNNESRRSPIAPEDMENDADDEPDEPLARGSRGAESSDDHSGTGDGNDVRHQRRRKQRDRRQYSQSVQASRMIHQHIEDNVPPTRGSIVVVYSKDRRDARAGPKTMGVLGVVFNTPRQPQNAIFVVTVFGIIILHGREPRRFTPEWYHVADDTAAQGIQLRDIRLSILNNTFNEASHRGITLIVAHRMWHGHGVERVRRCTCSRQGIAPCRSNQCGCKRNGQKCTDRCSCGPNCCNTHT
jgi:hypothetical protein